MRAKRTTTFGLSDRSRVFLKAMSDDDSLTQTAVLELLIRKDGERRKYDFDILSEQYKDVLCQTE